MLGFTQPGSSTAYAPVSIDDLANLPTAAPQGASNPFSWAWYTQPNRTAAQPSGVTGWLQANSTAVIVISGALFLLALTGGRR